MSNRDLQQQLQDAFKSGDQHLIDAALRAGADINVKLPDGALLLHAAIEDNDVEMVKKLLQHGADPNLIATEGRRNSALVLAVIVGTFSNATRQVDMMLALLNGGAKVDLISGNSTALMKACRNAKSYEQVELLLQHGADVNLVPEYMDTPLTTAAMNNLPQTVRLLLQYGANLEQKGATALDEAKSQGHHEVAAILEQHRLTEVVSNSSLGTEISINKSSRIRL